MKKLLLSLLCIFSLSFVNVKADEIELPEITEHEKVKIYLFRGNGCGHCYNFLNYFNGVAKNYSDYFEIVTYEVWYSEANSALMKAVAEAKELQVGGVPFIVIGDSYTKVGFSDTFGEELIKTALKEYENEKYTDVVAEIASEHSDAKPTSLKEACIEEGIVTEKKKSSNDAAVIIGIFAFIIVGGVALVFFSRKK